MTIAREALVDAGMSRWPDYRWAEGRLHHGAFHLVLTAPDGPSLRATLGRRGRERSRREASALVTLDASRLPLTIPQVLDGPHWAEPARTWITCLTTVPGSPAADLTECSAQRVSAYADILTSLREASSGCGTLPPVRAWCGGDGWAEIVHRDLSPRLEPYGRRVAAERVEAVLEAESHVEPTLCHGDFGPHNILWSEGRAVSVIDLDHACLGDPAIDIAPLISFHGVSRLAPLSSADTTRRAMLHRATLPLQVAASAHLAGLGQLRDHALANFTRRVADGTLFDPTGETPEGHDAP
ncbi:MULTISPECIES: aminoglycoside phosphotransferase family protein [unclassified Brachybacterium]|uniref:aminoglycoside phosphotransferase family protein n=1 Tax=unclassified Brachybacterium TaxID=2623841 RepID=UPI00130455A3|nr:aminoglycoside phosphotransferase family protein [Brachybacterium sp. UMB0905]